MPMRTMMLCALGVLAGCVSTTPELDLRQGEALRNLRAQQTLDPQATERNTSPVVGVDGKAARGAMENYRDSFRTPPAEGRSPQTVIGIGTGQGM